MRLVGLACVLLPACSLIADFGEEPRRRRPADAAVEAEAEVERDAEAHDAPIDRGRELPEAATCDDPPPAPAIAPSGWVYFRVGRDGGHVFRIKAEKGAVAEDVAQKMRDAGPAPTPDSAGKTYEFRDISAQEDGTSIFVQATRWLAPGEDTVGYAVSTGTWKTTRLRVDQMDTAPLGRAILSRGGAFIVFEHGGWPVPNAPSDGQPLFLSRKAGSAYTKGEMITGATPFHVHRLGGLSPDETRVVSACWDDRGVYVFKGVCETDVAAPHASRLVVGKKAGLDHEDDFHFPGYDRDGAVLFSAAWRQGTTAHQVWRARKGCDPVMVSDPYEDDGAACALPNGNYAAQTRDGGRSKIRIIKPDKTSFVLDVPLPEPDFTGDTRLFCGE